MIWHWCDTVFKNTTRWLSRRKSGRQRGRRSWHLPESVFLTSISIVPPSSLRCHQPPLLFPRVTWLFELHDCAEKTVMRSRGFFRRLKSGITQQIIHNDGTFTLCFKKPLAHCEITIKKKKKKTGRGLHWAFNCKFWHSKGMDLIKCICVTHARWKFGFGQRSRLQTPRRCRLLSNVQVFF